MIQTSIPLVTYTQQQGYSINPQAQNLLISFKQQHFAIIGIVGKARTGKSYLLNQLLNNQNAFGVQSKISTCTKGIRMYTKLCQQNNMKFIVLDSQGLGANESTQQKDSKILLLNMVICSMLLYNSRGVIDQQALNTLSLIIGIGKALQKQIQQEQNNKGEASFPFFFWVIRDFILKMENQEGFRISSKQYLQKALEQQKGLSISTTQKNRIRRIIKGFFKDRDCETLVRPVETEEQLHDLSHIPTSSLRQQFRVDIQRFKKKLMKKLKPKKFKGKLITGNLLVNIIKQYLQAFNNETIPKMQSVWNKLKLIETKEIQGNLTQKLKSLLQGLRQIADIDYIQKQFDKIFINLRPDEIQSMTQNKIKQLKDNYLKQIRDKKSIIIENEKNKREEQYSKQFTSLKVELQQKDLKQIDLFYENRLNQLKNKWMNSSKLDTLLPRLQIIYLKVKIQKLIPYNLKNKNSQLELNFSKKQIALLTDKNVTLQRQRITLMKTIQSQEKSITELRQLIKKKEQSDIKDQSTNKKTQKIKRSAIMDDNFIDNQNSSMNVIEKILQMYKKLEQKHHKLQELFSHMNAVTCSHCSENIEIIQFQKHYQKQIIKRQSFLLYTQNSKQSNVKNNEIQKIQISNPSFFTPYIIIPEDVLKVQISKTLIKQDNQQRNYIQYTLDVILYNFRWSLNRKYKDFCQLHDILLVMFPKLKFPDSSAIVKVGMLSTVGNSTNKKNVVEQRRKSLQNYLEQIILISDIRNTRIIQKFLKINKQYRQLEYFDMNISENRVFSKQKSGFSPLKECNMNTKKQITTKNKGETNRKLGIVKFSK